MIFHIIETINFLKKPRTLLFVILLGAFILRMWDIDSRDIWYDELLTIQQSEKSISEINIDVPTPIHYYFVHLFLFFGKSTMVLGLPSVIFGLLTIFLVFLVAKRIADERVGLVAAFLLAISPMHIEFSQQILFFSYFTFFSSLILYLVTDFAFHFEEGRFKWGHLLLLVFVNWINVLTQMLALVLVPVQLLFFCYLFAKNPKMMLIFKKYLVLIPILIVALFLILLSIGSGGYVSFLETLHIGFERPITVGYSLSSQLESTVIGSPMKFFHAMFSWFGIGGGVGFLVYLCFSIIGIVALFWLKTSRSIAFLFILWLAVPFVVLFSVRIGHWFEEKYFIFMIPVYLILIALGIVFFSKYMERLVREKISTLKIKDLNTFFLALIFAVIAFLAIEPIKSRTTFGFPFKGHVEYSWRAVYDYLKENVKQNDKIFLVKGGAAFLNYYYVGDDDAKKKLLDDDFIARLTAEEYQDFVDHQRENYFISIPDYNFLFLNDITDYEKIDVVGNFNIYKIIFKKESPIKIQSDDNGQWQYYENFRTSRYISSAYDWKNMVTTYSGINGIPKTEGFNVLSPIDFSESYIDYKFILPDHTDHFYINTEFSIDEGSTFHLFLGEEEDSGQEVYTQSAEKFSHFNHQIKIDREAQMSRDVFLRLQFDYGDAPHKIGGVTLKSFNISSDLYDGVQFPYDYVVDKNEKDGQMEYVYNAKMEIEKSEKWTKGVTRSVGWIQTNEGFLVRDYGTKEDNPLIFKFNLGDNNMRRCNIEIKAFATHTNPIEISYSTDENTWDLLEKIDDNIAKEYNFGIDDVKTGKLFLRFHTELVGTSSQVRNIKVVCQ